MTIHTAKQKGDALSQVSAGVAPLAGVAPPLPRYNRKEKSLGLLCDKLLATYDARPIGSEVQPPQPFQSLPTLSIPRLLSYST